MAFQRFVWRFGVSTAGAVTVDWVVLVAAVVFLGLLIGVPVSSGVSDLAASISYFILNGGPL